MSHLWCPRCDLMAKDDGPDHSCGTRLEEVPHNVDMTDLLMVAQALAGLVSPPPGFVRGDWSMADIQDDLDRRDEMMATTQAEAEALA